MNDINDEMKIRQLVADWSEATKRGDVHAVLKMMTDDVVFLIAGRAEPMDKATFAAAMQAQQTSGADTSTTKLQMQTEQQIKEINIAGDVAYMWTALKLIVTPPGANTPITRAGHTLTVLRKDEGLWKIARDANMLMMVK